MVASDDIAERLLAGERSALARLISWAENADPRYPDVLRRVHPRVGRSWRIGITGPPGAGKSTLTNALVARLRQQQKTVGVLAIDPSSPFSGGALLGDRIRMEERTQDPGVYIRSMASRDSHGGLARAAVDACDVMDAFGFDVIVMETVGVGQSEYDVVAAADTVLVVLCPGAGDGVQAMKAGILEVADVLVVNKADLEGADQLTLDLEDAVRLRDIRRDDRESPWSVPVVPCSARDERPDAAAQEGRGLGALLGVVERHKSYLEAGDLEAVRRGKRVEQVRRVVRERLEEELWGPEGWTPRVESSLGSDATPYDVAAEIVREVLGTGGGNKVTNR